MKKRRFTGFVMLELLPSFHKFALCILARRGEFCPDNITQQYLGLLSNSVLLDSPD